jgi:phosphatidylinositol glycan class B
LDRRFFLGLAVAIHLAAALCSGGWYALDEHFQTIEFAGYRLGFNQPADLSWEFHQGMRPALQPAVAYVVIRGCEGLGISDPFVAATVLRLLSAALSVCSLYLLYFALAPRLRSDSARAWLAACSCLLWFLPYQHVRFSSETWSAAFYWSGTAILWMLAPSGPGTRRRTLSWCAAGALLGLAFVARPQSGLLILPVLVWLAFRPSVREAIRPLACTLFGAACAVGAGILLDRWFYGQWTLTAWNYLHVNLTAGAAEQFGRQPWWFYLRTTAERGIHPLGVAVLAAALWYFVSKPRDRVTWALVPFLAVHVALVHKETRFLFPLVTVVPFLLVSAGEELSASRWFERSRLARRFSAVLLGLAVVLNLVVFLLASLKPADPVYNLYRFIYRRYGAGDVRLFYDRENPYERGAFSPGLYPRDAVGSDRVKSTRGEIVLEARFYRPPNLVTRPWDPQAVSDSLYLYASRFGKTPDAAGLEVRRVYSYLPDWVRKINVTGWIERTQNWSLWEVRRVSPP